MSNEQLALLMFTAYGDETTKLSSRADFTRRGTCFPDERQKNRPLAPAMTTQKWRPVSGDHALSLYSWSQSHCATGSSSCWVGLIA